MARLPKEDGRHTNVCNRFIRWSRLRLFNCIFNGGPDRVIDRRHALGGAPNSGQLPKSELFAEMQGALHRHNQHLVVTNESSAWSLTH